MANTKRIEVGEDGIHSFDACAGCIDYGVHFVRTAAGDYRPMRIGPNAKARA
jgi:hypothetical protein